MATTRQRPKRTVKRGTAYAPVKPAPPPPDPAAPTKMELIQAQRDGEMAGRVTAENMGYGDFNVGEGDVEGREPTMCDLLVGRAHKDVESGGYGTPHGVPRPPKFAPLQSAYWTGFDWAVQRKFACVCSPGEELEGLRRRRRSK